MIDYLKNIDFEVIGGTIVAFLIAWGLGYLIYSLVDCAQGTSLETTGQLMDKYHKPSWVEPRITTVHDESGLHQKIETIYHPDEYVFSIYDGDGGRDIEVRRAVWFHYKPGDWVKMRKRYGKRSKCKCRETVL